MSWIRKSLSQVWVVVLLLSSPALVLLLDIPATTFAGCDSYGYGCSQTACFGLEVTTDSGSSWKDGTVYIYGTPGSQVTVHVRTVMGVISGNIEGWSFSVRHDASVVTGAGGDFDLTAASPGLLSTVKCGAPPDFEDTEIRPCGYTQGVVLDTGGSGCKLNAPTDVVTSYSCYSVTMPSTEGVYPVTLQFTDDVGDPRIRSIVTKNGQSEAPCKLNLTLNIYSTTSYYPTPSYCPLSQQTPLTCPSAGGGGGPPACQTIQPAFHAGGCQC